MLVACGKGKLKTWGLTAIPGGIEFNELATTGDTDVMEHPSPGFCYVPMIDKFVAWASGPDVYTLDLDAKRWRKHPPAATNKVTPGKPDQWGTFGRFRYVPSRNVFVLCNAVDQNVFLYRLTGDRPNVITAVEAKSLTPVDTHLSATALAVEAVYADGNRRDVTDEASYFSLDPQVAEVDLHGRGVVRGFAPGKARIRAVYSDPAFNRGFGQEVTVSVRPLTGDVKLESLQTDYRQLTIVAGDRYQLGGNRGIRPRQRSIQPPLDRRSPVVVECERSCHGLRRSHSGIGPSGEGDDSSSAPRSYRSDRSDRLRASGDSADCVSGQGRSSARRLDGRQRPGV